MKHFVCHCCGNCCRWGGVVCLLENELLPIAEYLGLALEEFTARYTSLADDRSGLVLNNEVDGRCCFLDAENHCRIQPVKPVQCSSYPYAWLATPEQEKRCQGEWVEE